MVSQLYQPLDPSRKEIRLVGIDYADGGDAIKCSMIKTPLESHSGRFIPISYVWGEPNNTEVISVNEHSMAIRTNIAVFLRRWREITKMVFTSKEAELESKGSWSTAPELLWIDSICINQDDPVEKTYQVQLMAAIYAAARYTIAWLGESSEDSSLAINSLRRMSDQIIHNADEEDKVAWLARGHDDLLASDNEGSLPLNSVWRSIQQFFLRPFWSRAWILQELVLSHVVWMWCGSDKIFLDQISHVVDWVKSIRGKSRPSFCSEGIWSVLSSPTGLKMLGLYHPWTVVQHIRHNIDTFYSVLSTSEYLATDPRDHIFSKINLSNTPERMSPDYSKSVEEVYSDFAQAFSQAEGRLYILQYAGIGTAFWAQNPYHLFVPTWAPNWDQWSTQKTRSNVIAAAKFHADGNPQVTLGKDSTWSFQGRYLHAQGLILDSVRQYSFLEDDFRFAVFCSTILRGNSETNPLYYPHTGKLLSNALIRLACLNQDLATREQWSPTDVPVLAEGLSLITRSPPIGQVFTKHLVARTKEDYENAIQRFEQQLRDNATRRLTHETQRSCLLQTHSVFGTDKAYLGWGPLGMERGDLVCILFGCRTPVILRRVNDHYLFIGPCFVLGIMDGEAVMDIDKRSEEIVSFTIA